jgi:translation elongation factor EF-Tu-like GTPase
MYTLSGVFRLTVDDVFFIRGRGTVVTGRVELGSIRVGDTVQVNIGPPVRVDGIEAFRKRLDEATEGENVGLLLTSLTKDDVNRGDVISA